MRLMHHWPEMPFCECAWCLCFGVSNLSKVSCLSYRWSCVWLKLSMCKLHYTESFFWQAAINWWSLDENIALSVCQITSTCSWYPWLWPVRCSVAQSQHARKLPLPFCKFPMTLTIGGLAKCKIEVEVPPVSQQPWVTPSDSEYLPLSWYRI